MSDAKDILKGLTAHMLSMAKIADERAARMRQANVDPAPEAPVVPTVGPLVAQALHVDRPFEAPIAPSVPLATPFQSMSPATPDFMVACKACGYIHKSDSTCTRCHHNEVSKAVSVPFWRR